MTFRIGRKFLQYVANGLSSTVRENPIKLVQRPLFSWDFPVMSPCVLTFMGLRFFEIPERNRISNISVDLLNSELDKFSWNRFDLQKFYVISWLIFHLNWKNYILFYWDFDSKIWIVAFFTRYFTHENLPLNSFSSQNFSIENNYLPCNELLYNRAPKKKGCALQWNSVFTRKFLPINNRQHLKELKTVSRAHFFKNDPLCFSLQPAASYMYILAPIVYFNEGKSPTGHKRRFCI